MAGTVPAPCDSPATGLAPLWRRQPLWCVEHQVSLATASSAEVERSVSTRGVTSVRMNRWVILAGYALLAACTQLLWLAYAPITTQTHRIMGVSQGAVGDLAVIFPLMYVILALPAGRWLDARFGRALGLGAVLTGGGGLVRLIGPSSYGWAM